jgi:enoyl-CoA hydratase/carnithine racemase
VTGPSAGTAPGEVGDIASAADQSVVFTVDDRLASVRLERPAEGNRLTSPVLAQLAGALRSAAQSGADVLALTAAGDDFSLGRDPHEVRPSGMTRADSLRLIVEANRAFNAFPGISVTAVQGRALGFACGLAVQSDLTLAAETATFGFDEVHVGRPPRFVMAYLADFIGPKRALDLVVTGRAISAADAERFGFVSRIVPAGDLAGSTQSLIAALLELDQDALRTCKSYPREIRRVDADERDEYAYAQTVGPGRPD